MHTNQETSVIAKAEECFLALLDEELTYPECQAWINWLDEKPDHQAAYDQTAKLWAALDGIDPKSIRIPAEAADAPRPGVAMSRSEWLPVALVCTLVSSVVLGIFHLDFAYFDRFFHEQEVLETQVAQVQTIALADGTITRLAGDTRIEIEYSGKERKVTLVRGEAFFEVSKDAHRPFIVLAGSVEAKALGTKFDVNKLAQTVIVTVEEGQVQVAGNRKEASGAVRKQSTIIGLGERVSYSDKGLSPVEKIDLNHAMAWKHGTLVLRNRPLAEVLEEINRFSSKRILFRPDEIAGLRVSGTVNLSQTDDWLQGLEKGFPLKVLRGRADTLQLARSDVSSKRISQ
ncbi:MAG: hypothetical protein D4S02_17050 [Rhodocyclaceae bacterium]|nr:MAG: hypothetical protein D4S02_17050 [Rhodocyclaceae bacterium]